MLRCVSWNIYKDNKDQIKSFQTLVDLENPDVICLQEVSPELLDYLKNTQTAYEVESCQDFKWKKDFIAYLVILSKSKILHNYTSQLHNKKIGSLLARHNGIREPREFHFVDLLIREDFILRVINLHLEVATGTKRRQEEFYNTLSNLSNHIPNVICGDFNIFANPLLNIFIGWAFNFGLTDYLALERGKFEKIFNKFGLKNLHYKKITYPKFRLQLDHILIDNKLQSRQTQVATNLFGSDHYYISTTLAPTPN